MVATARQPPVSPPRAHAHSFVERKPEPAQSNPTGRLVQQAIQYHAGANRLRRYRRIADDVLEVSRDLDRLDPFHLQLLKRRLQRQLRSRKPEPQTRVRVLGLVHHSIRQVTGLSPYPTQIIAAQILLDGALAEMQTGEGKSLAILMAATAAALAGTPVHVLTANDYLAQRDADKARQLGDHLDLTVGLVTSKTEPSQRQLAYRSEILFTTAREIAFDYLRDNLGRPPAQGKLRQIADRLITGHPSTHTLLGGLHFAIIDEADSILLDEAVTPFILSSQGKQNLQAEHYTLALKLADEMSAGNRYSVDEKNRRIHLTENGKQWLDSRCTGLTGLWRIARFRNHLIEQALAACHLFARDRDYLVKNDQIHIIDPVTGRLADGRKWSHGIHQMLELKESVALSCELEQLAKITYQQLFPRYFKLAGASGTLAEDKLELLRTYGLPVIETPLRQPSQRQFLKTRLFRHDKAQIEAITQRIRSMVAAERAVLVATSSVEDSWKLSNHLTDQQIEHVVLNARQDAEEAEIVSHAGQPGRVTVATNMAGRGADIKLHPCVVAAGGLHIIRANLNPSRRIDRQVEGRCARNGEPGSVEALLSLSDPLIAHNLARWVARLLEFLFGFRLTLPAPATALIIALVQKTTKWRARRQRRQLMKHEDQMRKLLAIGGGRRAS